MLELVVARRPDESAISEGNLVENPLFVLSNKEAKPKNKADYTKLIRLGTTAELGRTIERSVKLSASPEYGFPTMFAYRVLLAIIEKAHRTGFESPHVDISRHEIARYLGCRTPGKREYEDIENACNAMASMYIQFQGTWYDKSTKSRSQSRDGVHILDRVQFRDSRQGVLPGIDGPRESGSVTVGEAFFQSLRAGYYNGVDLAYLNALKKNPLAQKLYAYLTKKDQGKLEFTVSLVELAVRFDLKKRRPSALYDKFAPVLELLSKELPTGPKKVPRRFLKDWRIDRQACQMTVVFLKSEAAEPPVPALERLP